ncbi:hypothetical protein [Kingella potus]|nr:hypothetical protein [Kingella potus]UOP00734.1 hypothetical protein LVJ84_13295 [Kingella potus]
MCALFGGALGLYKPKHRGRLKSVLQIFRRPLWRIYASNTAWRGKVFSQ